MRPPETARVGSHPPRSPRARSSQAPQPGGAGVCLNQTSSPPGRGLGAGRGSPHCPLPSGAEDRHGYIWDRHYNICLAKLRHEDVVNSVVFSPQEQELLLTASDDATIKAWRSPRTVRVLQAPRPRPRPFFSWFASQKH